MKWKQKKEEKDSKWSRKEIAEEMRKIADDIDKDELKETVGGMYTESNLRLSSRINTQLLRKLASEI